MTKQELIDAMDAGNPVYWHHEGYICYKSKSGEYLKTFIHNDHTIGIFHRYGVGMNLKPEDCFMGMKFIETNGATA